MKISCYTVLTACIYCFTLYSITRSPSWLLYSFMHQYSSYFLIFISAVSCGTPHGIGNGYHGTPSKTTQGGTVRYYCNSGFFLSGSATVTCLSTGSWSTRPTCSKYYMHVHSYCLSKMISCIARNFL